MALAVFLRAVNVGGTSVVSVAAIAKKLGLINIGAAGTFVSTGKTTTGALRKAIAAELSFETEIIIVPAAEIARLVADEPLAKVEGKPFIGILATAPMDVPGLPIESKGARLVGVDGPFALAVILPDAKPGTSATALVEKALGVRATVRGWPTMLRVAKALESAA